MKVGDLVQFTNEQGWDMNDDPMTNGVVVGFDKDNDPIVFFTCRNDTAAYYENDIKVLNESR